MNTIWFDFACCRCGEQTAIQPSIPESTSERLLLSGTATRSIFVACPKCKRVYTFDTGYLISQPTTQGFAPYNPDAPMRVFPVSMKCDELNCEAQLLIHVMMNANTTDEQLRKEMADWNWSEFYLRCEFGHLQPYPPYRPR
jgi:nitrite reductase/ring-hydroxylating ferredoxin subunit